MHLFTIFAERKEQLKKQQLIDNKLKDMNCDCPAIVSEYLLLQRQITRNQQYIVINTTFLGMYEEMHKQLKVNQYINDRFLHTPNKMDCNELKKIINEKNLKNSTIYKID